LDWGLVEYATAEDAERAQSELNGHTLRGHHIRITYYIPGVRAINLFLKLLNEPVIITARFASASWVGWGKEEG